MANRYDVYELSTGFGVLESSTLFGIYYNSFNNIYPITKNDYFERSQPAKSEELVNVVSVPISAGTEGDSAEEIFVTDEPISIPPGGEYVLTAEYTSVPVLDDAAAVLDSGTPNISISNAEYYSWGAVITLLNSGGVATEFELTITGTVLNVDSKKIVTEQDLDSQLENGLLKYEYPENHLIQSETVGRLIAGGLLESYKTPRKDVSLQWRGDPALELGDIIEAPIYQRSTIDQRALFYIYKNKLSFDGGLRASTEGRLTQ